MKLKSAVAPGVAAMPRSSGSKKSGSAINGDPGCHSYAAAGCTHAGKARCDSICVEK